MQVFYAWRAENTLAILRTGPTALLAPVYWRLKARALGSKVVGTRTQPYERELALLNTIPGVDGITVWTILAELGDDISAFPGHCLHLGITQARWASE